MWCLKWISKLDYFGENLRLNGKEDSKRSSLSGIDIVWGDRVVSLHAFLLIGDGLYKRPFMSQTAVLIELAEAHFESEKRAEGFEKVATKREALREESNNGVLKAHFRKLL